MVSVARRVRMDGWLERHGRRRLIVHGITLSLFAVIIMWKSISAVICRNGNCEDTFSQRFVRFKYF